MRLSQPKIREQGKIIMKILTMREVFEIWLDSSVLIRARKMAHRDDWGDQQTIGVHLKRVGISFPYLKGGDFAVFLGKHSCGFVVYIKTSAGGLASGEVFDTLDELKTRWEIH
jgi:hypothetical protein